MRLRTPLVFGIPVIVLMLGVAMSAQSQPNFGGKWTLAEPSAQVGFGAGFGMAFTAVQDEKTLTITRDVQGTELKSVYNLDGSDSKNSLNVNGNSIDLVSKAKWDGGKLVIATTANFGGNTFETSNALSLDASGILTVESTRPDFQGGGAPITSKATYKKAP